MTISHATSAQRSRRGIVAAICGALAILVVGCTALALSIRPDYIITSDVSSHTLVSSAHGPTRTYIQPDFAALRASLQAYVAQRPASLISLHLTYLPTGQTIDILPDHLYPLESLAKLPIIILLYRQVEAGLVNLDSPMAVQSSDIDTQYGSLWLRGIGSKITLRQAVQAAVEDSDNTAIQLIRRTVISHTAPVPAIGAGLDVSKLLRVSPDGNSVTAASYAGLLKCLYTACQTSQTNARTILGYMTYTHDSAIRDGSGSRVTVADKFGLLDKSGSAHLYSDCGIAYSSNGNYILCIMAQNPTQNIRSDAVALSSIVSRGITQAN